MKKNIGNVFEAELKEAFKKLEASYCTALVRFTDTKEAGSVVRATPSDYLLLLPPESKLSNSDQRVIFFEAKASEVEKHLTRSMLRPAQKRAINHFSALLKIPYIVCFWDAKNGVIEVWDGLATLGSGKLDKKYKLLEFDGAGCGALNTDRFVDKMADFLKLPLKRKTLENYGNVLN